MRPEHVAFIEKYADKFIRDWLKFVRGNWHWMYGHWVDGNTGKNVGETLLNPRFVVKPIIALKRGILDIQQDEQRLALALTAIALND